MKNTSKDFLNSYRGKRVLVTGHTGFKGAWLSFWLNKLGAKVYGYALEEPSAPATYTALNIKSLLASEKIADLADFETLKKFIQETKPQAVFHLAAQPLVRLSYREPLRTIQSNITGTAHVLEALRVLGPTWITDKTLPVVVVTSDKCYHNREWVHSYREEDPMGGKDIYSMTKGACELVTASYRDSFFPREKLAQHKIALSTARAGNVIGGGDYAEDRIIPDAVRALMQEKPLYLRNPKATRPWQHVLEPLSGYLALGHNLMGSKASQFCEGWNFGPLPDLILTVEEVVDQFFGAWGKGSWKLDPEADQAPHEAHLLKLSIDKAAALMKWLPVWDAKTALSATADWYKAFESKKRALGSMQEITRQQIETFEEAV